MIDEMHLFGRPERNGDEPRKHFETGAVRSADREGERYDLISPIGLREVARTCAEGAAKYDDFNWEKGMPAHDLLNHAVAHIFAFLGGDRSESHLGHAAWNVLGAIHSLELWPELNEGHLRGPMCTPPQSFRMAQDGEEANGSEEAALPDYRPYFEGP